MTERKRGGWTNPASADNGRKATGGGRPPQSTKLRIGDHVAVSERTADGVTPRVTGRVTAIDRKLPRGVTITMDDGGELRLWIIGQ